jgi:hypothetical protein
MINQSARGASSMSETPVRPAYVVKIVADKV